MEGVSKNWRVIVAALFSAMLVFGAYVLARGIESPSVAQASTETALLKAIASKDTDGDGLPDWEEALYGTDPHIVDTFHLGMSDGQAVAQGLIVPKAVADISVATSTPATLDTNGLPLPAEGTLTAVFAKNFFALYLVAKQNNGGANLSESEMSDISNQAMNELTSSVKAAPDFKSIRDIIVVPSNKDVLMTFAADAETILLRNTNDATTTDLNYFRSAMVDGNASAYGYIASIAKGYRDSAVGLAMLPVPQELADDDLLLINSLVRMSQLDTDFTKADADPLAAMLALQQYQTVAKALEKAFTDIGSVYAAKNLSLPPKAPGALFVNMIADIDRAQKAVNKP